jgi:hypothetical protein
VRTSSTDQNTPLLTTIKGTIDMRAARLTALGVTAALAVGGAVPATGLAKATKPGKHTVTKTTYVYTDPGVHFTGTMFKGETFKVERISKSGRNAYGMAYGHVNRHAWIPTAVLKLKK